MPLFAESLVELRRRGDRAAPADEFLPPPQIAVVLQERLSFATPADQRLLEAAIAVGFTFEVQFVASLTRTDLDQVYDQLDDLMREHHLIVEAEPVGRLDRYAISHPLLAAVIERRASADSARWRRYHQRLVDVLLEQPVSDELAVRMAAAAIVAQDPRATELSVAAAARQYRGGAVTKAPELAQAALSSASADPASALSFEAAEILARSLSAEANHREAAIVCDQALGRLAAGTVVPERIWKLMLLRIRSLRMINAWQEAEYLAATLQAQRTPDADRVRAEILMLQAEFALCGLEQDTERCIRLCGQVAALDQGSELTSRAAVAEYRALLPVNASRSNAFTRSLDWQALAGEVGTGRPVSRRGAAARWPRPWRRSAPPAVPAGRWSRTTQRATRPPPAATPSALATTRTITIERRRRTGSL